MTPDKILNYCLQNLEGTVLIESQGEKGIFYNPDHVLKRGVYMLTVKEKDGDNDKGSDLNRENVYRVNLGIRKSTFTELFGAVPKRPPAGSVVDMDYDFTGQCIQFCVFVLPPYSRGRVWAEPTSPYKYWLSGYFG